MDVDNVDYFAKNIKYLRLQKGLKQSEICAQIGFVQATWSEYEHGWSKPRFNDLLKIIAYFDITASELMEMDLEKGNLNDFLELRKIVKKGNVKGHLSGNLNSKNTSKEAHSKKEEKEENPAVLEQLNRMEEELKKLRKKLAP